MHPDLPKKSSGDALSANHVNKLSEAAESALRFVPGGGLHGAPEQVVAPAPFVQRVMEVVSGTCDWEGDPAFADQYSNDQIYQIRPKFYESTLGRWVINEEEGPYCLDASAVNQIYAVGSTLVAYYDPQRGAFIPVVSGSSGSETIHFEIIDIGKDLGKNATGCDFVEAVVTQITCGGGTVAVGDEVRIWDPEYCHFNIPRDLLIGLHGVANKMDNPISAYDLDQLVDCQYQVLAEGDCRWLVEHLSCAEQYNIL